MGDTMDNQLVSLASREAIYKSLSINQKLDMNAQHHTLLEELRS